MKRLRSGLLFTLFVFLLTACGKDDDNAQPQPETNNSGTNATAGVMTAEVNGVPWKSATAYAAQVNTYGLTIIGQFNNEAISITTNAVIKPGDFDAFSYQLLNGAFALNHGASTEIWTTLNNPVCKLEITKLDWVGKRISGTFAFNADSHGVAGVKGVKTVTKGIFTDLPLTVTTPLNFSLTAQVNNTAWSGSGMYITGGWGFYELQVSDSNGHAISINGFDLSAVGPQQARSATYIVPTANFFDFWSASQSAPATVTITQFDPVAGTASGTFSFIGQPDPAMGSTGTKTVSQGVFTNVPVF